MPNIYNFTYENLEEKLISLGEKKFRTRQIWQWLYEKRVKSFDEMRNLSSELISKLKDSFSFDYIEIVTAQRSDSTNKYLFQKYLFPTYLEVKFHSRQTSSKTIHHQICQILYLLCRQLNYFQQNKTHQKNMFGLCKPLFHSYISDDSV